MSDVRKAIIATYAEWTAMSALRAGAPIKSRRDVYTALRGVHFAVLFAEKLGPINRATFDTWHADAARAMIQREPRLTVGWATKIISVYLKTRVYVGAQGRPHLEEISPFSLGLAGSRHRGPGRPSSFRAVGQIGTPIACSPVQSGSERVKRTCINRWVPFLPMAGSSASP